MGRPGFLPICPGWRKKAFYSFTDHDPLDTAAQGHISSAADVLSSFWATLPPLQSSCSPTHLFSRGRTRTLTPNREGCWAQNSLHLPILWVVISFRHHSGCSNSYIWFGHPVPHLPAGVGASLTSVRILPSLWSHTQTSGLAAQNTRTPKSSSLADQNFWSSYLCWWEAN